MSSLQQLKATPVKSLLCYLTEIRWRWESSSSRSHDNTIEKHSPSLGLRPFPPWLRHTGTSRGRTRACEEKLDDRSAASRDRYQKDGPGGQTINIVLGGADQLSSTGWFKDESKATIQRAKVKSIIIKSTWELIKQSMTKQNGVRGTGNEFLIPLWFGVSGVFNYIDMKQRDTLFLTHHCNLG